MHHERETRGIYSARGASREHSRASIVVLPVRRHQIFSREAHCEQNRCALLQTPVACSQGGTTKCCGGPLASSAGFGGVGFGGVKCEGTSAQPRCQKSAAGHCFVASLSLKSCGHAGGLPRGHWGLKKSEFVLAPLLLCQKGAPDRF